MQPAAGEAATAAFEGAAAGDAAHIVDTARAQAVEAGVDDPSAPAEDAEYNAALRRVIRLFAVYVDAGGALCMRQTVWRRLMSVLHPDRGGHVRVFQMLSVLKRQLDANESIAIPPMPLVAGPETQVDAEADALETRLREEMRVAAGDDNQMPAL